MRSKRRFIIIGGGASGSILAINALLSSRPGDEICMVEKRTELGRGIAYSTREAEHRLNVRASNMSVFADDPGHFSRWLAGRKIRSDDFDDYFAPRGIYGEYVESALDLAAQNAPRLSVIAGTATGLLDRGRKPEVELADGSRIEGDTVILATGHEEAAGSRPFAIRPGSLQDIGLSPDKSVMILGTGLSMADVWLSLVRRGHVGPVIALSRRGLLPLGHEGHKALKLTRDDIPLGTGLTEFVRWFRQLVRETEQAGRDWRDVVDGLRPFNQEIWRHWPSDERRRFFEHTKAWWDIHRHRMAPEVRKKVYDAKQDGRLRVAAARVRQVDAATNLAWSVTFQHRHSGRIETVEVDRIYDCQGIINDLSLSDNPLIRSMIAAGAARPDHLRIGLDVDADCSVRNTDGVPSKQVFAVGPLTRGTFLEIDAIPDIRVQARDLIARLMSQG